MSSNEYIGKTLLPRRQKCRLEMASQHWKPSNNSAFECLIRISNGIIRNNCRKNSGRRNSGIDHSLPSWRCMLKLLYPDSGKSVYEKVHSFPLDISNRHVVSGPRLHNRAHIQLGHGFLFPTISRSKRENTKNLLFDFENPPCQFDATTGR